MPDPWAGTLVHARAAAEVDGKPIILFFPSPKSSDPLPPVLEAPRVRGASAKYHLARARAIDLEEFNETVGVKKYPAVFLLDRDGVVVARWDGIVPADFWRQLERTVGRLKTTAEEVGDALDEARSALAREDFPGSLSSLRKVRSLVGAGDPRLDMARSLEVEILARASAELRRTLAVEGIAGDPALLDSLGVLKARFPHPSFQALIGREIARVRDRAIAGKRDAPEKKEKSDKGKSEK
jgi:hypothetical protein